MFMKAAQVFVSLLVRTCSLVSCRFLMQPAPNVMAVTRVVQLDAEDARFCPNCQ